MARNEFAEQSQLCKYVKLQYPDVIFASDLSGVRLPMSLAVKVKDLKCDRGIPDLFIYEPKGYYKGLAIELKATGVRIIKKNGDFISDNHLMEQKRMLERLSEKGYLAVFCVGFEQAKIVIDSYLKTK